MCGLCAALNAGRNWTDMAGKDEFSDGGRPVLASQQRARLVGIVNRGLHHYGITVTDWGGGSYVVSNAMGQNENVYAISAIWKAVDALLYPRTADPLDRDLVARLELEMTNESPDS